jgi:hypothetical protein
MKTITNISDDKVTIDKLHKKKYFRRETVLTFRSINYKRIKKQKQKYHWR